METLTDIRQANQEAARGSRRGGLSLPSLRDSSRRCSHLDPAGLPGLRSTRTACMPAPPQNRQRTRSVVAASPSSTALLSAAEPRQLSRSAPSIMEPLCSNAVMQAGAHSQTRLVFQDTVNEQKGPLLAQHPRMPKLLAPLTSQPRDIAALPVLKHRVPLKPISRIALCSRTWLRRERLFWGSPPTGLLITKGGSEESGSSSQSSSCDLEDEEYERDVCEGASGTRNMKLIGNRLAPHLNSVSRTEVGETQQHFKVLSKISSIPPIQGLAHDLDGEPIGCTNSHCEGKATNDSFIKYQYAQQDDTVNEESSITSKCKGENNNLGCPPKPDTKSNHGIFHMNNDQGESIASCEGTYRIYLQHIQPSRKTIRDSFCEEARADDPIPRREDVKLPSVSTDGAIKLFTPAGNLPRSHTDPRGEERRLRTVKHLLNKDRRTIVKSELRAVIQTTQLSLSVLAHKNRSILNRNKSKSNVKGSTQGKDKTRNAPELIISGETVTKLKSRLNSVKSVRCHIGTDSPGKKVSDQGKRASPDKINRAQQHAPEKELKSIGQLKRDGLPDPPRSKSSAAFTTSKDMLQEIQNGDEALAIHKKFLDEVGDGPLTDDLLQCLAEELITLEERGVSTGPENLEFNGEKYNLSGKKTFLEDDSIDRAALLDGGLVVDDTTTWTKGEVLGRGAYGIVYCGLTSQGHLVAVKQVSLHSSDPDTANTAEYGRLQREVELLKNLRHANIVGFLGTSLYQHVVSIFMEYIPGGSIASILQRFGPLPERVLALYTHQILEGVAYLHLNRVIHRDLKGNNVMLMPTGVIKLIDFGCARRLSCLNHTASHSADLVKSVHGTPYWMAPEVINETGYGRKSDIWSVGCTVFEMATGKPPLAHMDKMAALFYIGARRGLMPTLPSGFSDHAKNFVKICLTSDQRLRPSADQLLKHSFIPKRETGAHAKNCCAHPEGLCG
ncbi:uncharacterized protein map3k19 isoform X3 [Gasterosteus aculeatus]